MELTKEIREILEDIVWWDTFPTEYKSKINAYLKSENETALNIDLVSYRFLEDGEKVEYGDEYIYNDEWVAVHKIHLPYVFTVGEFYTHRRKL